jgi:diguanylate cyclase (GGDEF)-like protein/PAS domain S-box-containing protein
MEKKLRIAFLLGIFLLAVDAAIPLALTQKVAQAQGAADRLEVTLDRFQKILSSYKDSETGQRGFMLTGRHEYLEPYIAGRRKISELLPAVARELGDDPRLAPALDRLQELDRLASAYQVERIAARERGDADTPASAARGKTIMDGLRRQIDSLSADRSRQRQVFLERARYLDAWNRRAIVIATLIDMLLLIATYLFVMRAARFRGRSAAALESINLRLKDEIANRTEALQTVEQQAARLNEIINAQGVLAQAGLDIGRFMRLVVNRILLLCSASGAAIELIDGDDMVYQAGSGSLANFSGFRMKRENSLSGMCVRTREMMFSPDARNDSRADQASCEIMDVGSMILAPLLQNGQAIGVLKLVHPAAHGFVHDDAQTILLMAGVVGSAMGNQLQFEKIAALLSERSATLDALETELRRRKENEAALLRSRHRTHTLIESSQEAFLCIDRTGLIRDWNHQAELTFGWSKDEAIGRPVEDLIIPERLRQLHRRGLALYLKTGKASIIDRRIELPARRRDGTELQMEMTISVIRDGDDIEFSCFMHDIDDRKRSERALQRQEETLRKIMDTIPAFVSFVDTEQRYRYCNQQYAVAIGVDPTGKTIREAMGERHHANIKPRIDDALNGIATVFETPIETLQGKRSFESRFFPQIGAAGAVTGFYIVGWDITDRKHQELQWQSRASLDALTGLYNRAFFLEALDQILQRHRAARGTLAVLYMDIDRFKQINDTYGHAAGDSVLRQFATHIKGAVRHADIVSRFGGDEFCVVLENIKDESEALAAAEKMLKIADLPLNVEQMQLHISVSIGVACATLPDMSAESLVRSADAALYKAKRAGRNRCMLERIDVADPADE